MDDPMDHYESISQHPPTSTGSTSASGRSWGSAPEKSRFHSRPQEVQHISEGRSECLGEDRSFGPKTGGNWGISPGLTMV